MLERGSNIPLTEGQELSLASRNKEMGSEIPKSVIIYVTGGVSDNPTETIVNQLKNYAEKKGLPAGVTLGSCIVIETAGEGALSELYKIMESGISTGTNSTDQQVVWLHLGVNSGAFKFGMEQLAANEATFQCPDEHGWQPQQFPIIPEDGGISKTRKTSCSNEAIQTLLKARGFDVTLSQDAGRFVCNYVYYHSLRFAEQKGHKSLFVHVPLFSKIGEETQMQFILALLEAIASTC